MRLTLLLLTLLVLGFGWAQDAPEPVAGGELTVAITAEPPGWDPSASTSNVLSHAPGPKRQRMIRL